MRFQVEAQKFLNQIQANHLAYKRNPANKNIYFMCLKFNSKDNPGTKVADLQHYQHVDLIMLKLSHMCNLSFTSLDPWRRPTPNAFSFHSWGGNTSAIAMSNLVFIFSLFCFIFCNYNKMKSRLITCSPQQRYWKKSKTTDLDDKGFPRNLPTSCWTPFKYIHDSWSQVQRRHYNLLINLWLILILLLKECSRK